MMRKFFLFIFILFFEINQVHALAITPNPAPVANSVIDQSGTFIYSGDIEFDPTMTNDFIISITANDVIIDLGGNVFSQKSGNTVAGLNGIVINPNVKNVTIKNGRISGLTGIGIKIGDGCFQIFLQELDIIDCDEAGILVDGKATGTGIDYVSIRNCNITSCTGSGGNPAYGLRIKNADGVLVADSFFFSCDAQTTNSGFGISVESSQACEFVNCQAASNGGNPIGVGIAMNNCTSCLIKDSIVFNSIAHDVVGTGTSYGFLFDQCNITLIKKAKTVANINYVGDSFGLAVINGSNNILDSCFVETNIAGSLTAGILISNESTTHVCFSESIRNQSLFGMSAGILLTNNTTNCVVRENHITNNVGAVASFGIKDDTVPSSNFFPKNEAFNNGINYSITYTAGVVLPVIAASLSKAIPGLPTGPLGALDNLSIDP